VRPPLHLSRSDFLSRGRQRTSSWVGAAAAAVSRRAPAFSRFPFGLLSAFALVCTRLDALDAIGDAARLDAERVEPCTGVTAGLLGVRALVRAGETTRLAADFDAGADERDLVNFCTASAGRWSAGSHVLALAGKPFHFTKYIGRV
jgi:hypothetical protein